MNKKHIYLAGSLFSEAEVNQRLVEGQTIRDTLGDKYTLFNPIEAPINDKSKLPTKKDIFDGDTNEILKSDVIIADLANNDPGVMMELGIAWGLKYAAETLDAIGADDSTKSLLKKFGVRKRDIYTVLSDIRIPTAGEYKGIEVPFGFNQYVLGGIYDMDGTVHNKFVEVIRQLEEADNE